MWWTHVLFNWTIEMIIPNYLRNYCMLHGIRNGIFLCSDIIPCTHVIIVLWLPYEFVADCQEFVKPMTVPNLCVVPLDKFCIVYETIAGCDKFVTGQFLCLDNYSIYTYIHCTIVVTLRICCRLQRIHKAFEC